MDKTLLRSYRFHRENGGGIVGQSALWALRAARAELLLQEAIAEGVAAVHWCDDDEPYEHGVFTDDEVRAKFDSNEWTGPFGCVIFVGANLDTSDTMHEADLTCDTSASLWGIVVGPRNTGDPYCRVIEADLALEVENDLRQALGDARDARRDEDCGICRLLPFGACDWHRLNPA